MLNAFCASIHNREYVLQWQFRTEGTETGKGEESKTAQGEEGRQSRGQGQGGQGSERRGRWQGADKGRCQTGGAIPGMRPRLMNAERGLFTRLILGCKMHCVKTAYSKILHKHSLRANLGQVCSSLSLSLSFSRCT